MYEHVACCHRAHAYMEAGINVCVKLTLHKEKGVRCLSFLTDVWSMKNSSKIKLLKKSSTVTFRDI